jgi:hypothetical protein
MHMSSQVVKHSANKLVTSFLLYIVIVIIILINHTLSALLTKHIA